MSKPKPSIFDSPDGRLLFAKEFSLQLYIARVNVRINRLARSSLMPVCHFDGPAEEKVIDKELDHLTAQMLEEKLSPIKFLSSCQHPPTPPFDFNQHH